MGLGVGLVFVLLLLAVQGVSPRALPLLGFGLLSGFLVALVLGLAEQATAGRSTPVAGAAALAAGALALGLAYVNILYVDGVLQGGPLAGLENLQAGRNLLDFLGWRAPVFAALFAGPFAVTATSRRAGLTPARQVMAGAAASVPLGGVAGILCQWGGPAMQMPQAVVALLMPMATGTLLPLLYALADQLESRWATTG
jgi:hypothetical protein